jgi:hypothetical protein
VGSFEKVKPGSFLIEVILWLCFFIPGLIYSIWRINSKKRVCSSCGSASVVANDSPMGMKVRSEMASFAQTINVAPMPEVAAVPVPSFGRRLLWAGMAAFLLVFLMNAFRSIDTSTAASHSAGAVQSSMATSSVPSQRERTFADMNVKLVTASASVHDFNISVVNRDRFDWSDVDLSVAPAGGDYDGNFKFHVDSLKAGASIVVPFDSWKPGLAFVNRKTALLSIRCKTAAGANGTSKVRVIAN